MPQIQELRSQLHLTQADLSKLTGLRVETISRIESRKHKPHRSTVAKLAKALEVSEEEIAKALLSQPKVLNHDPYRTWTFLKGLDRDLKKGLIEQLICQWTHNSTSLEGNTISAGDTHLILTEGVTVSGKSLKEHEEIHGHGSAIKLLTRWQNEGQDLTVARCHELHRLVQTSMVYDIYAPVGEWKVEQNGTTAIRSEADPVWYEYSEPHHVDALMKQWLHLFKKLSKDLSESTNYALALNVYTILHLGFVMIHPYADGNGRMARLLANMPLLKVGLPPILIHTNARRAYLTLLGDYCTSQKSPRPGDALVEYSEHFETLRSFFKEQWTPVTTLIDDFHTRQKKRGNLS